MTTTLDPSVPTTDVRPRKLRRAAVAVTGLLASALPLAWGMSSLLELLGGQEAEHRFHQITGQGLLLAFLWLYGVVRVAVSGWQGRRPRATAALTHLGFVAGTVLCGLFVPGEGVRAVAAITVVTGGLLWLAVPRRTSWRGVLGGLDPLLTPLALLGGALYTPYLLAQRALQATAHDEHAELTHYFDMAWVCAVVALLGLLAAVAPGARRLGLLAGGSTLVIGLAGLAFTADAAWSGLAVALGCATLAATAVRVRPRPENVRAG